MSRLTLSDSVLATALDGMGEASLITDAQQRILYANAAFAAVTGYSSDEIVGLNCRMLQDAATDPVTVARIARTLGAGEIFRGEILNRKKNGPLFWNSLTISPIRDQAGAISNFVSVQTDVTARVLEEQGRPVSHSLFSTGILEMHMQPIIDLAENRVVMVEALARLLLPDGRTLAAADFVPGLSAVELERLFVDGLDQSLCHLAEWDGDGRELAISLNLDPITLGNPLCAGWVEAALLRHGIESGRLTLELLETQAVNGPEQIAVIAELGRLGVQFAIDDLGSGHSNLERLAHIPFDLVKIDSSIVAGFETAPIETLTVMFALIQLSRDMRRIAVVEGLETLAMLDVATVLGAPLGQGFQIARPMPAAQIPAWLAAAPSPVDHCHLATAAAVLAFHWRYSRNAQHPGSVGACSITRFLADTVSDQPGRRWHSSQHGAPGATSADDAQKLTLWLTTLIGQ